MSNAMICTPRLTTIGASQNPSRIRLFLKIGPSIMANFETIKSTLAKRNSIELLSIWIERNTDDWRPEAFTAIAEILTARNIPLPEFQISTSDAARTRRISLESQRSEKGLIKRDFWRVITIRLSVLVAMITTVVVRALTSLLIEFTPFSGHVPDPMIFVCSIVVGLIAGYTVFRLGQKKFGTEPAEGSKLQQEDQRADSR